MKPETMIKWVMISALLTTTLFPEAQGTKGFVIKQVYYAGSDNKTAAGISDQFIEIQNNSKKILFADGLYLSFITGARIVPGTELSEMAAASIKDFAILPDGRFDWTQSYGMNENINANDDYIYARTIYQIPGHGKEHPVKPGHSIVIAQSAKNYKNAFTRFNGSVQVPTQPERTVDLSHADFEVNMLQVNEDSRDQENPAVQNMIIIRRDVKADMMMDWNGKEAIVIYRYNGNIMDLPVYTAPLNGKVKSKNKVHLQYPFTQIPAKIIMDAVELQPGDGSKAPKRLPEKLDADAAGKNIVPGSSLSILRKTTKKNKRREWLQDTNNSSYDFITIKADPKINNKK